MKEEEVNLIIKVTPELRSRIKMVCVQNDKTIKEIGTKMWEAYLRSQEDTPDQSETAILQ